MDTFTGRTWALAGWDTGISATRVGEAFGDALRETVEFRGELTLVVDEARLYEILSFLRDDADLGFDFLTDVTGVHWPARERPFDVVYQLYSFKRNARLRVKAALGPEPRVKSAVPLWPAAGWLERECFDMLGIVFEGHPDLRRILMPEDFDLHPLRKDVPLKF